MPYEPKNAMACGTNFLLLGVAAVNTSRPASASFPTILLVALAMAFVARIIFWAYTGRIWEDALISLNPARNVWEGFGLTHHASEPHVHSFTSALGEMILIAGEAFRSGLLAMRLASLGASCVAIYCAYQIGARLRFPWPAQVLVLGYLAMDQLQIFFGMAGMETQVATALAFASIYFLVSRQPTYLGIALGLAVICRPEFCLIAASCGLALLLFDRKALPRVVVVALAVAAPWIIFATIYYGSPIPHTIEVKQAQTNAGFFHAGAHNVWIKFIDTWQNIAPFRQYWAAPEAPIPDQVLLVIVMAVISLAVIGAIYSVSREPRMLAVVLSVVAFFTYRTTFNVDNYFMWYLPPFVGLLFLLAASGVAAVSIRGPRLAAALAVIIVVPYALHQPFTLPLDRTVQVNIEEGVRARVGVRLNELMGPSDTAVLEPLGYIGWAARNKTIYDYPGLSSPISFAALKRHLGFGIPFVIQDLKPTFIALRASEIEFVGRVLPSELQNYEVVERFQMPGPDMSLFKHWGLTYWVTDKDFTIFRRKAVAR